MTIKLPKCEHGTPGDKVCEKCKAEGVAKVKKAHRRFCDDLEDAELVRTDAFREFDNTKGKGPCDT